MPCGAGKRRYWHPHPQEHSPAGGVVGDSGEEVEGQSGGEVVRQLVLHQAQLGKGEAVRPSAPPPAAAHCPLPRPVPRPGWGSRAGCGCAQIRLA